MPATPVLWERAMPATALLWERATPATAASKHRIGREACSPREG